MKKLVFFILMMLFAVKSYSQLERVDMGDYKYFTDVDKKKTIYCVQYKGSKGSHFCIEEANHVEISPSLDYAFEKTKKGTVKYWELSFSLHSCMNYAFSMRKGNRILLRLFDDTVLTLLSTYVDLKSEDEYGTFLFVDTKISNSVLNRIKAIGVKKIRIETTPYVCDAFYENDEIGVFVKEAIDIINKMTKSTTKKAF